MSPKTVPRAVSVTSQATDVSSLATAVTGINKSVASLIKANNANMRAVAQLSQALHDGDDDSSEDSDVFGSDYEGDIRVKPKRSKKRNKNNAALVCQKPGKVRRDH